MTELGLFSREDARKIAEFVRREMAKGQNRVGRTGKPRTKPRVGSGGGAGFTFELTVGLDASDSSGKADVVETWGGGTPSVGANVDVENLQRNDGQYVFAGKIGHRGIAVIDTDATLNRIIQMECMEPPEDVGDWVPK